MANVTVGFDAAGVQKTHATVAAAFAAASAGDNLQIFYSNATKSTIWNGEISDLTTKVVGIEGMIDRRAVTFYHNVAILNWYRMSGDLSGAAAQVIIQNIAIFGTDTNQEDCIFYNDTSGTGGGVRITNCEIQGFRSATIFAGTAGVSQVDNCLLNFNEFAVNAATAMDAFFNTAYGNRNGFDANNNACNFKNCFAYSWAADFLVIGSATVTYCASADATADDNAGAGNLINVDDPDDIDFWRDNDGGIFAPNYRILTTSDLYQAGNPVAGITTDIDGTTRDVTTPSIGFHEGTATASALAGGGFPGRGRYHGV